MDTVKIGIIGTGWIAEKMAITLEGMEGVEAYAVASRQLQTACDFADRWGFTRAYGSYEEMLDDEEVELVYIATPHSHHFEHARMSLLKGKAVLCEKAYRILSGFHPGVVPGSGRSNRSVHYDRG